MDEYNNLSEEEKKNYDVNKFGEGVDLVGYNDEDGNVDLTQALTPTSYKFDGIDDYIKIKYDGSKNIEVKDETGAVIKTQDNIDYMKENGLTFEFYGKLKGCNSYNNRNNEHKLLSSNTDCGLFGIWSGDEMRMPNLRVRITNFSSNLRSISISPIFGSVTIWGGSNDGDIYNSPDQVGQLYWNYDFSNLVLDLEDDIYFSIVIDPKDEFKLSENDYIRLKLFVGENVVLEKSLNKNLWNFLCEKCSDDFKYILVGRCSAGSDGFWHYFNGDCYSLRVYNTALTDEQIRENKEKTEWYHNILLSEVTE